MHKVPIEFVTEWFSNHSGDVFRCNQAIATEDGWKFPFVFVTKVKDSLYIASERDLYKSGLGQFYDFMFKKERTIVPDEYIRTYEVTDPNLKLCSFHRDEEGWKYEQEMPWFEEGRFNRCKFLSEVYKYIEKSKNDTKPIN